MVQSNAKTRLSTKETTDLQDRLENHKVPPQPLKASSAL